MTKYDAIHAAQQRLKQKATPAQKRREFKRQQFIAKKVASQTLFVSVFGLSEHIWPVSLNGQRRHVSAEQALAIEVTPLPWVICCYALCKDISGNPYIKGMELHLQEPVKQSAIHKALSHKHYDWMRENVNVKQLLTLAWIATTATPPTEKMAMQLFLERGAFDAFDFATSDDNGAFMINFKERKTTGPEADYSDTNGSKYHGD